MINAITNKKTLFFRMFAKMFSLCVLALKLLNIPININSPKNAVKRYSLFTLFLNREFM